MKTFCTSAALFVVALFTALPMQAQLAYVDVPTEILLDSTTETGQAEAATKLLRGQVQGLRGLLPGATVWLKDSRTVAVANAEGMFELPVPADAYEVEVTCSYEGLQEEVIRLAANEPVAVVYLLRTQTPRGQHFASDLTLKDHCESLVKKVLPTGK